MIKKIAIGLLILALLVAAVTGIVTWQFSTLVTPQIERYLRRHGVETLSTSEVKWRFNRLRMEAVEASGNLDDNRITLQLSNVDIGYQWWRLFGGNIDSIAIERADVRVTLLVSNDETMPADLLIPTLMPQAWLDQLPVDAISVARLDGTVQSGSEWVLAVNGKNLNMSASGRTLQGVLMIRDGMTAAKQGGVADASPFAVLEVTSSSAEPLSIGAAVSNHNRLIGNAALIWSDALDERSRTAGLQIKGRADLAALTAQLNGLRNDPHPLAAGLPLDWLDGLPVLAGSSDFDVNLQIPEHIRESYGVWLDQITFDGHFSHQIAVANWPEQGLSDVTVNIAHAASGNLAVQSLVFSTPITLSGTIAANGWGIPRDFGDGKQGFDEWQGAVPVSLQLEPEGPLVIDRDGWKLAGLAAALALGPDNQRVAVNVALENIVALQETFSFDSDISAAVSLDRQVLVAPRLTAQVKQDRGAWRGKGELTEDGLTLAGNWQAEMSGNGAYRCNLKGKFAHLPALLKQAETYMPLPMKLVEGTGSFAYDLKGTLADSGVASATATTPATTVAPTQSMQFTLTGLTGLLEGVALQGASLQGVVENTGTWQSRGNIELNVPVLEVGVRIEAVKMDVQLLPAQTLAQTRWRIHKLTASLFSGTVALREPFTLNLPVTETRFEILLSNWQLGSILGLYEEHGLSGNGILSGVLPVTISSEGVAIQGGVLASQPPGGLIVYDTGDSGKAMAARNEHLDLAMSLLENFEYEALSVKADFVPTGELLLGLQLSGRNPDAFGGRPVNFNINVEENLFDLFKALTLTDDVINKLEKRLNR